MGREYRLPLLISLLLHGALIGLLAFSLGQASQPVAVAPSVPQQQAVEVRAVEAAQVEAEVERLRQQQQAERQRVTDEAARQKRLREQAAAAQRKRQAEERRLAELARKRAAEEKQRQAEAERVERLRAEQVALERQKAEEQARLAELERQRLAEAERQRRLEAEKKRREEERQRREAEQALQQQLAEEERRLAAERSRTDLRLKAQYVAEISGKVQRNWLRPPGIPAGLRCTVRVRQLPGGEVVGVSIVESSGNVAFDRSVEGAVRKASPLPAPPDPALFEREIDFIFSGE